MSFCVLEALAIVALLSSYPGMCSTDSNDILDMAQGINEWNAHHRYEGLSAHHPLLYTLSVKAVLCVTAPMGNIEFSVFVFILIQTIYTSLAVAMSLALLARTGVSRVLIAIPFAFYALSPVLVSYEIFMWKDIPFSATLLLLTTLLMTADNEKYSKRRMIAITVLVVLLSFLRSNGLLVGLFTLVVVGLAKKAHWRQVLSAIAVTVVVMGVYTGPVYALLHVAPAHFSEAVSMPMQQLAATVKAGGDISIQDRQTLDRILPLDIWGEAYNPKTPNPLKFSEDFDDAYLESHKAQFLEAWIRTAPANVNSYVKAWLMETEGYWHFGYIKTEKHVAGPYKQPTRDLLGLGLKPSELLNGLSSSFPLLFGMGSCVWLVLFCLMLCCASAGKGGFARSMVMLAPALAVFVTLMLAAPICSDFRYVFGIYFVLPMLPAIYQLAMSAGAEPSA